MKPLLWVCGQVRNETWEIQGVFSSEFSALAACKNSNYFIGPVILNKAFPEEGVKWEGCYYPIERYGVTGNEYIRSLQNDTL